MRKTYSVLLLILMVVTSFRCKAQDVDADSLIRILKKEIANKKSYDLQKERSINQLKTKIQHLQRSEFSSRFNTYLRIFELYKSFKFDSAFVYANRMIKISEEHKQSEKVVQSNILLGFTLLNSGFYKEAFDIVERLDKTRMPHYLRSEYLILRSRLYSGIAEYNNDAYFTKIYYKQSEVDFKNAETVVPANEFEQTISKAFLPPSNRDKKLTPRYYYNYILNHNLGAHGIAMASTRLSFAYTGDNKLFFLALAAINDIRSATKETLAIYLLGQELYEQEKTEDAYYFMQEASDNAKFYGSRNRQVQIESVLPLISTKLLAEKQHNMDRFLNIALILLLIALVLFFLLFVYRGQLLRIKANELLIKDQNNKLQQINEKLWESARIKEELIGLFLKSCSSYIEMLDGVKRKVIKAIKSEKYADLKFFAEGLHIEEEKEKLYETLDKAFLKMFPNFVNSFNALLKKEDQIWPKSTQALNATLRIFALMRLGIDELKIVAKILGYSESTIYTYKFRIKSKSVISTHDFDRKIMEIKFNDNVE
ncbi:hypothetical protein EOD41_03335 [Mucilaginibacter limnophilus]|uniref:DUF6377 domain-containing protein n=1 Tax=Mucilaginibacter limnophilus TaxID=1932778 RepID=A0A3S2Y635_9SPHI|nr:DUF6377 domain-containing protein [Mucilaginibacter limnophilus]RVU02980.1 hypothetical protein EOD41_03335 [Mucilaginibacter limnophilus]